MEKFVLTIIIFLFSSTICADLTDPDKAWVKGAIRQAMKNYSKQAAGNCDFFNDNTNLAVQEYFELREGVGSFSYSLAQLQPFTLSSDGEFASNTAFVGKSNAAMVQFFSDRKPRLEKTDYIKRDRDGNKYKGPTSPDGNDTVILNLFCPGNSAADCEADPSGFIGQCERVLDHLGFQDINTAIIYLPATGTKIITGSQ